MGPKTELRNKPVFLKFLKITNTSTNKVEKLNHNIIIQSGKVPTIKDEVNS